MADALARGAKRDADTVQRTLALVIAELTKTSDMIAAVSKKSGAEAGMIKLSVVRRKLRGVLNSAKVVREKSEEVVYWASELDDMY